METFSSQSEMEAMRVLIDTKMAEFHNAIKAGKEFAYIKQIYLEAKQLADNMPAIPAKTGCIQTLG